jgi:hypothetical protein
MSLLASAVLGSVPSASWAGALESLLRSPVAALQRLRCLSSRRPAEALGRFDAGMSPLERAKTRLVDERGLRAALRHLHVVQGQSPEGALVARYVVDLDLLSQILNQSRDLTPSAELAAGT